MEILLLIKLNLAHAVAHNTAFQMYAFDYFIYRIGYRLGQNRRIQNFHDNQREEGNVFEPLIQNEQWPSLAKPIGQRREEEETKVILLAYPR